MTEAPRELSREAADALAIWKAAVAAVDSERLVRESVAVVGRTLRVGDETIDLAGVRRIEVVGAGKAGAGMAAGLEAALGPELLREKSVSGWVNVPADCVRPLSAVRLHPARPAGLNEPTEEGAAGTREILRRVAALNDDDLCFCLISGGGSALLPAPLDGLTVADKQAVARFLSGAGATIQELNAVRKRLSLVKGGGLARACRAGRLIVLVISDVIGDPLDVIASGPTVPDSGDAAHALSILERFGARAAGLPERIFAALERNSSASLPAPTARVTHHLIGTNRTAVDAAVAEAERRGYHVHGWSADAPEGSAESVGRALADRMLRGDLDAGEAFVSGGEPVVNLPPASERGRGGRNQQLVLAALDEIVSRRETLDGPNDALARWRFAFLSGGTDGEDGPTDAAGAWIDGEIVRRTRADRPAILAALARCDAYTYFDRLGTLVRTGPTHTNVMDVRVICVAARPPE